MRVSNKKISVADLDIREIMPGYKGQLIHSERMTFIYWNIDKGGPLPPHSHDHEQVVHMIEGEFELVVDGTAHHLKPGDVFVIPSHAKHSGQALTACRIMDAFAPVREDYILEE